MSSSYLASDINNNTSNNSNNYNIRGNEYRQVWPLKFIYRSQYGLEYDCIYNFLNTNSTFWNCLFKLDSLGPVFSISANSLPVRYWLHSIRLFIQFDFYLIVLLLLLFKQCITSRIDSGLSIFASKIDPFNNIALSKSFFYMIILFDFLKYSKLEYSKLFQHLVNLRGEFKNLEIFWNKIKFMKMKLY